MDRKEKLLGFMEKQAKVPLLPDEIALMLGASDKITDVLNILDELCDEGKIIKTKRGRYNERMYLTEYGRFVEQTIVPAEDGRILLCIMRDVTDEEDARREKEEISRQTMEVADKVVDKQMRIVQEIASLLGETAAETKIALTKLKESISDE